MYNSSPKIFSTEPYGADITLNKAYKTFVNTTWSKCNMYQYIKTFVVVLVKIFFRWRLCAVHAVTRLP